MIIIIIGLLIVILLIIFLYKKMNMKISKIERYQSNILNKNNIQNQINNINNNINTDYNEIIEINNIREESSNSIGALKYYNNLVNRLNDGVLSKYKINDNSVRYEDCFDKCDAQKCFELKERNRHFESCKECHKNPNKCFRKSIIGGNCDDCLKDEKQIRCDNIFNFGCYNYKNLNSKTGVAPYYIQAKYFSPNSPYDEQCIFCWNLDNYF